MARMLAILAMTLAASAASAQDLTLERIFADPPLAGPAVRAATLSPDGRFVGTLRARPDEALRSDLWLTDTATGLSRMAVDSRALASAGRLSEAELARRERARLSGSRGIVEYRWSPDGARILVPIDGDLWLATPDGATPRRLTRSPDTEVDAKISPRGQFASYARGNNLYATNLSTGREQAITTEGRGLVTYGQAEFVAQEEMKRTTGYWWSPDDSRVAVARVDETPVRVATRAAIGADATRITEQRYPFAGTPNALVSLEIRRVSGGAPIKVDLGPDPDIYLARVDWLDPQRLIVQRQSRDQKKLDVLEVDAATGASRLLFSETSPVWINLHDGLKPVAGGFLWLSERSGTQSLMRWNGAALTPVTSGWVVDSVEGVDEAAGLAFVMGFRDTVLEKALYAVRLDGSGEPRRITAPGAYAEAVTDKTGRFALVTSSSPNQPPQVQLLNRDGGRVLWVAENQVAATPYAAYLPGHIAPTYGTLKAADGQTLHYSLLKPAGPGPFPALVQVYGGPGVQRVTRGWQALTDQYLARRGIAVFRLDNRGSTNRGTAFEFPIHRALGTAEVEDQMLGLAWLKAQPFVDARRIAVNGWSYGGYMVLRMLTKHPGAFAAGIAGAPVTDWTLYDTHYTERYLGNPALDRAPYAAADVVLDANRLADPLLLIHGLADDNVVFDNSARMIAALQRTGKTFDFMAYPGQTHAIRDPGLQLHLWRTITRFLDRELGTASAGATEAPPTAPAAAGQPPASAGATAR